METGKVEGVIDSNFGFTALTNQKSWFMNHFQNKLIIEKATLEDIMIHTVRGKKN